MCGRFTLLTDLSIIVDSFSIEEITCEYTTGNNISPTQQITAVIHDETSKLVRFRWGLIPYWAKDPSIGNKLINARAETLDEKPAFKHAFTRHRCLIVADGFYEWKNVGNKKIPIHFSLKSGDAFGFAGLYDTWISPEHNSIRTCTVITTEPNELVKPVHDRMPAIISKDNEEVWLDANITDKVRLKSVLRPWPAEDMRMSEGFTSMP